MSEANRNLGRAPRPPQTSEPANEQDRKADETNTDDEIIEKKPKKLKRREEAPEDNQLDDESKLEEEKRLKKEKKKAEELRLLEEIEKLKREEEQARTYSKKEVTQKDSESQKQIPASNVRVPKRLTTQKIDAPVNKIQNTEAKTIQRPSSPPRHDSNEEIEVKQEDSVPTQNFNDFQPQASKIKKPTKLYQPQIKFSGGQNPTELPKTEPAKQPPKKTPAKDSSDSSISFDAGDKNPKPIKASTNNQDWSVSGPSISKKPELQIGRFKPAASKQARVEDDDWDA